MVIGGRLSPFWRGHCFLHVKQLIGLHNYIILHRIYWKGPEHLVKLDSFARWFCGPEVGLRSKKGYNHQTCPAESNCTWRLGFAWSPVSKGWNRWACFVMVCSPMEQPRTALNAFTRRARGMLAPMDSESLTVPLAFGRSDRMGMVECHPGCRWAQISDIILTEHGAPWVTHKSNQSNQSSSF
jgi:hypothetical protein